MFPSSNNPHQVQARDSDNSPRNSKVTYKLHNINDSHLFGVREDGMLVALKALDRESKEVHSVKVTAYDSGEPSLSSSCEVVVRVVDENDESPIFLSDHYNFELLENQLSGSFVGQVRAEDKDNEPFNITSYSFKMTHFEEWREHFKIDEKTGQIFSKKPLDREEKAEYRFKIMASDRMNKHLSSSATVVVVVVDTNDNQPVFLYPTFDNNTIRLASNLRKSSRIARVRARDEDFGRNSLIEYEISKGNEVGLFEVNSITGELVLTMDLSDDSNALNDSFSLEFTASDKGNPCLSSSAYLNIIIIDSWLFNYDYPNGDYMQGGRRVGVWRWLVRKLSPGRFKNNAVWLVACLSAVVVALLLVAIVITLLWQRKRKHEDGSTDEKNFYCNKNIAENDHKNSHFASGNAAKNKGNYYNGKNKGGRKIEKNEKNNNCFYAKENKKGLSPEVTRKIDLTLTTNNMLTIVFLESYAPCFCFFISYFACQIKISFSLFCFFIFFKVIFFRICLEFILLIFIIFDRLSF